MKAIIICKTIAAGMDCIVSCYVPDNYPKDQIENYLSENCGFCVSASPYFLLHGPYPDKNGVDSIPVFEAGQNSTDKWI